MPRRNDILTQAVAVLKKGGVVVFPTETSYGIAADAGNEQAVAKIFAIKGRDAKKSVPLIAADRAMVKRFAALGPELDALAKKHWPGALTVVAEARRGLSKSVIRANGTIAIRVSSHPIARALAKRLGRPIVATSANLSGLPACYSVRAFAKQIRRAPPKKSVGFIAIIDVGVLPRRKPSTIVKEEGGEIVVLRAGSVHV